MNRIEMITAASEYEMESKLNAFVKINPRYRLVSITARFGNINDRFIAWLEKEH